MYICSYLQYIYYVQLNIMIKKVLFSVFFCFALFSTTVNAKDVECCCQKKESCTNKQKDCCCKTKQKQQSRCTKESDSCQNKTKTANQKCCCKEKEDKKE